MSHKYPRHHPRTPLGLAIGKLALKVVGAMVKKKITDHLAARALKKGRDGLDPRSAARSSHPA